MKRLLIAAVCGIGITAPMSAVYAADPPVCRTCASRMSAGPTSRRPRASRRRCCAGYSPTKTIASVPITFAGIKSKQIDVFLGYWSPTMDPIIQPFTKAGQIKVLSTPNLTGAKYTLAVPDYVGGLKSFADIQKYADKLNGKIYGIEPGNDGNLLIKR